MSAESRPPEDPRAATVSLAATIPSVPFAVADDDLTRLLAARVRNGTWLDEQIFPPLQWAVPGLIPAGMGLFTGAPKAGKSWAVLGVALAIATGGLAFDKLPTGEPRPVLYLALEDGDARLRERCWHLLGEDEPTPLLFERILVASPAEVPILIAGWLARHAGQRPLVVLDTLGKAMPATNSDQGAYARDYHLGGTLKALVDAHPGATLLVVHHVRKMGGEDWMDSTSGTNGLNGSADFTINLSRGRGQNNAVLRVTGRDVREGEYALTFDEGAWHLDGHDLDEAERNSEQARAIEGVDERQAGLVRFVNASADGVRANSVAAELGMTPKDAGTYLLRAANAGRIYRAARGLYTRVGGPYPPVGSVGSVGKQATDDPSASYASCASYTHSGDEGFDEWWAIYPRKEGKRRATEAYTQALDKTDAANLLAAVTDQAPWLRKAAGDEPRFIPMASTWLNAERWLDEAPAEPPDPNAWMQPERTTYPLSAEEVPGA